MPAQIVAIHQVYQQGQLWLLLLQESLTLHQILVFLQFPLRQVLGQMKPLVWTLYSHPVPVKYTLTTFITNGGQVLKTTLQVAGNSAPARWNHPRGKQYPQPSQELTLVHCLIARSYLYNFLICCVNARIINL